MDDVRPGFRRTEVGVIPDEWAVASLAECATKIGSGITPTGGSRVYKAVGRPFVRSQNVGWGNLILDDVTYLDELTHRAFDATEIQPGDVFLNITGASIGRSAVADLRVVGGNVNQHVCIIRPDPRRADPTFLNCCLLTDRGQQQIDNFQAGGNRQGLNFSQVGTIQLPLPPLAEQRAIAAALADVDGQLGALDRLLAKARDMKQAVMQRLLTGRTRLPGFAGEWTTRRLGDFADVISGGTPLTTVAAYWGGAIPWITTTQIDFNHIRAAEQFITKAGLDNSAACLLPPGTLLMALYGQGKTRGKVAILDIQAAINQACAAIRLSAIALPEFVFAYLSTQYERIRASSNSGNQDNLNGLIVKSILVPLPPLAEQRAIAAVLTDMDAELRAGEAVRAKTRRVKQAMMHDLLTGRVRLV